MTYLNDFLFEGSNKKEFEKEIKNLSDHTEYLEINPEDLIIHSVESITRDGMNILVIKPEYCSARELFPIKRERTAYSEGKNYYFMPNDKCSFLGMCPDELKEIGFFMEYENNIIIPDKRTFSHLCRQIGVAKLQSDPDPMRELFIAYQLGYADKFKMLVRKENNVMRCMITYANSHHTFSQKEIFDKMLSCINDAAVTYFYITQNLTSIKISLTNQESILSISGKRKKISPCIVVNYSDSGEQALSVNGYISINGRGFYVGNPISNPKWSQMEDLEAFTDELQKEIIPLMNKVITYIESVSEKDTCNFNTGYRRIMEEINISSDIGSKLYEVACSQVEDRICSKKDLLFKVLDTAGCINKLCLDSKKKEIPAYAVKNCEKKIGSIFTSPYCREVFGWS